MTKPPPAAEQNLKPSDYISSSLTFTETTSYTPWSYNTKNNVSQTSEQDTDGTRVNFNCDNGKNITTKIAERVTDKETWLKTILDNSKHESTVLREIELKTQYVTNIPFKYKADNTLDPKKCVSVDTEFGRDLLASTLHGDIHGRIFFTLWQQFLTQSDSLLCGPSSMVMVLNALKVT